jgi:hypothetical protein
MPGQWKRAVGDGLWAVGWNQGDSPLKGTVP